MGTTPKARPAKRPTHGHGQEEEAGHEDGRITFTDEQLRTSGVAVETSGPGEIETRAQLPGEIRFNEDRTAHVVPRVAGVVESVHADLGQPVKKGQVWPSSPAWRCPSSAAS